MEDAFNDFHSSTEIAGEEANKLFDSMNDDVTERVVRRSHMGYVIIREKTDNKGAITTCIHNSDGAYRCTFH